MRNGTFRIAHAPALKVRDVDTRVTMLQVKVRLVVILRII